MKSGWSRRRLADALSSWLSVIILLALLVAASSLFPNKSFTVILTNFLIYTSMVVAYQMFMGNSGIVSFGQVAFFAVGAYTAALLSIPPEIKEVSLPTLTPLIQQVQFGALEAIVVGTLLAGLVALLIGIVITRMKVDAMGIATFALLVIVYQITNNWKGVTRGGLGLYDIPDVMTPTYAMIGLAIIVGVSLLFKASPIGLKMQGSREDALAAQSLGNNLEQVRLICYVLSAMAMAAGGGMWVHSVRAFGPGTFFFHDTWNMISMMVIGGQASVTGGIVGSGVLTLVSEIMRFPEKGMVIGTIQIPELFGAVQLSVALLLLATLIFNPAGIMGSNEIDFRKINWIKNLIKRIKQ
jgi:branched-chain amino acid transport system permease protein